MYDEDTDLRMEMMAAITAVTHCDVVGYKDALSRLPRIDVHGVGSTDLDADVALFSGSGIAS